MQQHPWKRGLAVVTLGLAAGGVWAQGAHVTAPGVDIRTDSTGTSVIVNGSVVNAASGPGAVAETHIPGRSITVRGTPDSNASVVVESQGRSPAIVQNKDPSEKPGTVAKIHVNADMSGVNLTNANLAGHRFTNVDLSKANLQGANLQGALLVNVSLENANLAGANLSGARLVNVSLDGALTTGATWTDGQRR